MKGYYEHITGAGAHEVIVPSRTPQRRYIPTAFCPTRPSITDEAFSCSTLDNEALYRLDALNRRLQSLQEEEASWGRTPPGRLRGMASIRSEHSGAVQVMDWNCGAGPPDHAG